MSEHNLSIFKKGLYSDVYADYFENFVKAADEENPYAPRDAAINMFLKDWNCTLEFGYIVFSTQSDMIAFLVRFG